MNMNMDVVERVRAETPGLQYVNHLMAAGSALMPQPVIDAVVGHFTLEAQIGGYEAHAREQDELALTYDAVAQLLNARRDEIALLENATAGWCHVFYSLPLGPEDRVLTSEAEYAANYVAFLQRQRRDGIIIEVIPSEANGETSVDALAEMIDESVKLVATTWVPTNGGLVNPAAQIGAITRSHGVPFLLDACQAVGQMPVDVEVLQCDFLTGTGRKFLRGPRGTGFLYVRRALLDSLEPAMIDHFAAPWVAPDRYELRGDARRFETWENAYALRAGLRAAVQYALDLGLDAIQDQAWSLAERLRTSLQAVPGATIRDIGDTQCAIVSFTVDGLDPRPTVALLRERGICIGASDPSSTLLDARKRLLPTVLRASPHYYNTTSDIDDLVDALQSLTNRTD